MTDSSYLSLILLFLHLPSTSITGQQLKYLENISVFIVADIKITLSITMRKSLFTSRSCISSTIKCDMPRIPFSNLLLVKLKLVVDKYKNTYDRKIFTNCTEKNSSISNRDDQYFSRLCTNYIAVFSLVVLQLILHLIDLKLPPTKDSNLIEVENWRPWNNSFSGSKLNSFSISYTLFNIKRSTLTSYGSTVFKTIFFKNPKNADLMILPLQLYFHHLKTL
ncbi:hypothetical protein AGLY_014431 [Aphis glycines]|uniref:Uncharacterized protein n=1 Tax=Aphis glycines TaxID=307491 RepID=A0A6G0T5L4_APHGL|nr:hypothetical protein AGLY_014431 [Aphis glycines]